MIEQLVLPAVLALIMVRAGLDFEDVQSNGRGVRMRALFAGLVGTAFLPLAGLTVATFYRHDPAIALGFALLALSPVGLLAGPLTCHAGGNGRLALLLTVGTSLAYLLVAPFLLPLLARAFSLPLRGVELPAEAVVTKVGLVTVAPVLVGMLLHRARPIEARAMASLLGRATSPLLTLLLLYLGFTNLEALSRSSIDLVAATVLLGLAAFTIANATSTLFHLSSTERTAITNSHLLRQEGTSMFVAISIFGLSEATLPLLVNTVTALGLAQAILLHRRLAMFRRNHARVVAVQG